MITASDYDTLKLTVRVNGYGRDIDWANELKPIGATESLLFWQEYSWVILNSGMKNQVARGIWNRVELAVIKGGSAHDVFGHKGKATAIDTMYANREEELKRYIAASDKLAHCRSLPWIGPITCYHLAKNLGCDVVKPDRHLVRLAQAENTTPEALCRRLSEATGDRIVVVDTVLWRAANLGLI
jgi:hypothetical protein